ncbi:unnamed protein product [Spirodela intermedia]|uniref:Uncharacterized protein n=1 Tax=Spirodela intermedia TaxID=51605 RepID=A0A7I8JVA8_SPIIN|nr:unnamed protein product [Spirodela intermedia]CAA6673392.1 unnamed protein product [Spirodela intermedia]
MAPAVVARVAGWRPCSRLFRRVRAEIRRQVSDGCSGKRRFSSHYDAFSYSLNFDNGDSVFFR